MTIVQTEIVQLDTVDPKKKGMYSTVWPYKCVRKGVYHERIPPDLSTKQSVVISYFVLPFPGKNLNFQSVDRRETNNEISQAERRILRKTTTFFK